MAVVGFKTATGGSVYDLSTWVVTDPSPDNLANTPAISITGDGTVTAGTPLTLTLNWAGVTPAGRYRGIGTYHQSASPTTSNIAAYSLVEINKSGTPESPSSEPETVTQTEPQAQPEKQPETPVADATPAPKPATPAPAPAAAAPAPAAPAPVAAAPAATALTVTSAKVSGRTLKLSLRGARARHAAGIGQARVALRGQGLGAQA